MAAPRTISRPKARGASKGKKAAPKTRAKATEPTNAISQKHLLYLTKIATTPSISDEPADFDLGVRHLVKRR
jgi:hypothetical protein